MVVIGNAALPFPPAGLRRRRCLAKDLRFVAGSSRLTATEARGTARACPTAGAHPDWPGPVYWSPVTIVSFDNVSKSFGGQELFNGVSFALDERDHAVLVGRNGSGKTTLLRLMAGGVHADAGRVARTRGRRVWLHEQTPELTRDRPVREYLMEAFAELLDLEAALRAAEQRASPTSTSTAPAWPAAMKDYQQLQRRFELAGGYHYRTDLEGVLAGLGPAGRPARPRPCCRPRAASSPA